MTLISVFSWQIVSAQYSFDAWTTDNGLPQNGVRAVTQTPDGYLWFTTFSGLVRFDGVKFTVFDKNNSKGIINNRFWVVFGAEDGALWAATEAGDLTVLRNGVFNSYPADQVPDNEIVNFSADAGGETLIETLNGFYYLRDDRFILAKSVKTDPSARIYYGKNSVFWISTISETRREKDGQIQIYPLPIKYLAYRGPNFYEDSLGGMWIGDLGKLHYLNNGSITDYSKTEGFPKNIVPHNFWEEKDGSLWFATGDYNFSGVGLVRIKDKKITTFGADQGLSNDRIFDIFKDREGTVWLATDRGLNRLRRQIITSLTKKDGLAENEVYPLLKARDGSIYIGSISGLSRYRDGKFSNILLRLNENNNAKTVANIQSLWEDADGRIWVGASGGVLVIENGAVKDITKSLNYPHTVSAIRSDDEGNIWLATQLGGVIKYSNGKIVAQYTTAEGMPSNNVKIIHESSDKSLWFGTYGGLAHLKDGKLTNYTTNEGLVSNLVRSIVEDSDGTMWIGTYDGGLSRFKNGRFFGFNAENGLFNNGVFATMEDNFGNFWISSNKGIYRVNKKQLNDFADGKIKSYESFAYGKQDGMKTTECNGGRQPSAIKDNNGQIWFPTLEGVAIVNPESLITNPLPPPVEIESVAIDRENIDFKETVFINPSQTHLDIAYTGLSFIKSDQIHFKYKLEGLDKDWIDVGTRRIVTYTHLPAGEYVFRVIAANTDGVWNNDGKSLKIIVVAPFYATWLFWTLMLFLVAVIIYLGYRFRVQQLEKMNLAQEAFSRRLIESQEAERKRIAQELHDGLGQNLLVIKNRAMLGLAASENKEKTDEQFNEIQDSVTDALSEVRTIAYNLRPLHIERLGLTSTIEEMIEEIETASEIEISCDIEQIDDLLSKDNEINLYRIIQESLNNIVKHSQAERASVEIFRDFHDTSRISLLIRDNGLGFDTSEIMQKKGLGLNGIAERTKILRGTYSIESEIGKGTTISVEIDTGKIND